MAKEINSRKRLYKIWEQMKYRCYNPKCINYKRYGGRGIEVCEEWKNDFQDFYDWSMTHGYLDNLTIDRIEAFYLDNRKISNKRLQQK